MGLRNFAPFATEAFKMKRDRLPHVRLDFFARTAARDAAVEIG
jgi:hypothetical protein